MKYQNLHNHTIYSDGSLTPAQLVAANACIGVDYFAITDHDSVAGISEARQAAREWGQKLVPGVEITTGRYHILGLCVDEQKIEAYLKEVRVLENARSEKRIELIRAKGFPLTLEKVREYFPHAQRIGKAHVIMALRRDTECRSRLESRVGVLSFKEARKLVPKVSMPGAGERETIDAIHAAGGIAILAHPPRDVKDISELDVLREQGIDGLEIQPGFADNYAYVETYAREHKLLITYGSDFHGPEVKRPLLRKGVNTVDERLEEILRSSC